VAGRKGDLIARLETDRELRLSPHAALDELRAAGPVVRGQVVWGTASHEAVTRVLRGDDFVVGAGGAELPGPLRRLAPRVLDPWAASPVDPPSMLATNGPDHTRYRRLVSRAFTARAVTGLEDRIRDTAERLLDGLDDGSPVCDVVERYAALLPVAVIADMLGVPDTMHGKLLDWGNSAATTLDPSLSWRDFRRAEDAMRKLHLWFADHVRELRSDPGDDLISRLAVLQDDERLTDLELRATGLLVLGAGFETTVNLIGNAVAVLDAHPDQRAALRDDPTLWGNAVDEVLRHDSPVQMTLRVARRDTDVLGVEVPARTPVITYLGGANRDPAVFDDPHAFDVRRPNAGAHLAFSSGAHFCLGASLARREAEVGLRMLYDRFPDLTVDGPTVRRGTRVLRGYERLPVSFGRRVRVA
ncbi:cytochrome P450, partial [Nocardioides sp.]|uniref:cytochrome P450 n=1 Tax=Nocardioides sp. TaxID=35761 RepID=UPI002718CF7C